jgi:hypothetical protein
MSAAGDTVRFHGGQQMGIQAVSRYEVAPEIDHGGWFENHETASDGFHFRAGLRD